MFDEMRNFCLLRKFPPQGSKHARCNERTQLTGARQYACEKGLPAGTSSVAMCGLSTTIRQGIDQFSLPNGTGIIPDNLVSRMDTATTDRLVAKAESCAVGDSPRDL
jgi:hypothetical protein